MRYMIQGPIERAKEEIEIQKRKIEREKREKQDNYELMIKMAERKIVEAQNQMSGKR